MAAGDAGDHTRDLAGRHQLGFAHGLQNALHAGIDIDDHAAFHAAARRHAQAQHFQRRIGLYFGHHAHDLAGADVQSNDQIPIFLGHGVLSPACFRFVFSR